jgi:hypothetical protein
LGGSCNGRCWYIFGYLVYFVTIWYVSHLVDIFSFW